MYYLSIDIVKKMGLGVVKVSKLYQLEYILKMLIICFITTVLLLPCVYVAGLNIYIYGVYINPFIAFAIAMYIQHKFIEIRCIQRDYH